MRKLGFILIPVGVVLAWLLWPQRDPQFVITFDQTKTQVAKAFLAEPAPASSGPNIVLIVADDLGKHDTALYGEGPLATPALSQLAAEGVIFSDGYITSPVCSPSRAALMTGRYQQRFGFELVIHDRYPRNRMEWLVAKYFFSAHGWNALDRMIAPPAADVLRQGLPPSELTLAELLKKHGYATGIFGKWHLGFSAETIPERRGFDYQYGFYDAFSLYKDPDAEDVVNARGSYFADRYQWFKGRHDNCAIRRNGVEIDESVYLTQKIADETIAWIKAQKKPYFAYVPFNAPHAPLQAERAYYDQFAHIPDETRRVYLAMIASLDAAIGRILQAVDDDTLVIFLSDNGGAAYTGATTNAPLKGGKFTNFEGGLNVPFVMRWPRGGVPKGVVYKEPVSSLDAFMTIAGAANVVLPVDRPYDGVDLWPYLRGEQPGAPHASLFWRADGHRAVRAGQYKLISDKRTGAHALYDVVADKNETTKLNDPMRAEQLERALSQWETQMVNPAWPNVMEFHFSDDGQAFIFPL